jgi:DNA-binding transcriptional regulator YiaG
MTGDEMRKLLDDHHISQARFARMVSVTPRAVNMWIQGERKVSGPAAAYLKLYNDIHGPRTLGDRTQGQF